MGRCHLLEQNGQYNIDQKTAFCILFTIEIRYEIRQDLVSNLIVLPNWSVNVFRI